MDIPAGVNETAPNDGPGLDPLRRFSGSDRAALYAASGGQCVGCGVELTADFHADHRHPHTLGGATDVANGAALCPSCNRRKGARPAGSGRPPKDYRPRGAPALRGWQVDALHAWDARRAQSPNFLLVATPGAGKTRSACEGARRLMAAGAIERVFVVVPTTALRQQWADTAAEYTLDLDPTWMPGTAALPHDMDGVVLTYAALASGAGATVVRALTGQRRTLVIFDEVHHCGELAEDGSGPAWGGAILDAFAPAVCRLALSGTPFRTDGTRIPFLTYDADGRVVADYQYGYKEALADGVCRPVYFYKFNGEMEWLSGRETLRHSFDAELPSRERGRRLWTALTAGSWLDTVLRNADAELSKIRAMGHGNECAGGLVVAADVRHARQIERVLFGVTGEPPVIATSGPDDPDGSRAREAIEHYRLGTHRWLIAVRMVAEGVDIPRLRVGVYATTALTELFFRQWVGRFVRMEAHLDEDQQSACWIPEDPRLVPIAERIKEEVQQEAEETLARRIREASDEDPEGSPGAERTAPDIFVPLDATAQLGGGIVGHEHLTPEEIEAARAYAEREGVPPAYAFPIAHALRILRGQAVSAAAHAVPTPTPPLPTYRLRKQLRKYVVQGVRALGVLFPDDRGIYSRIHRELNIRSGAEGLDTATVDQLHQQVQLLKEWREQAKIPHSASDAAA